VGCGLENQRPGHRAPLPERGRKFSEKEMVWEKNCQKRITLGKIRGGIDVSRDSQENVV